jgi:hypothetical protein
MPNVEQFLAIVTAHGQACTFHREEGGTNCPCRTPEGVRSPRWHALNPTEPVCNEQGKLNPTITNLAVKAFIQPIQSTRATRLQSEILINMFGEVEADDHLGIFPLSWSSTPLDFRDWSTAGEDYILFDGRRFNVVNANKIPDPSGGAFHHWEVAMRLIKTARPV